MSNLTSPMGSGATDIVGRGNVQYMSPDNAISNAMSGVSKGGMRGLGLVAILSAEYDLKKRAIKLAKNYFASNLYDFNFFQSKVQPALSNLVNEAYSDAINPTTTSPDYKSSTISAVSKTSVFDKKWFEVVRKTPIYNAGQIAKWTYEMALARKMALAAGWGVAHRYEQNYALDRNNRAFARKMGVLNYALGLGNAASQGMSGAVANLSNAYDNMGDAVASFGNGLATFAGYHDGSKATKMLHEGNSTEVSKSGAANTRKKDNG